MDCVVCFGDCLIFAKFAYLHLLCYLFAHCLMFANRIRKKNFSILPHGLLIWLEDKTLTNQHSESAFYPHRSANQQISKSAFYQRLCKKLDKLERETDQPPGCMNSLDNS